MKRLTQFLVALALVVAALLFGRNFIIKEMLEKSAKTLRDFDISAGDVDVGILRPHIRLRDLKVTNPHDFPEKQALDVKEVYVRYDFLSMFSHELHFPEIVLDVPKAVVVWNAEGDMNFDRIAGNEKSDEAPPKKKKKKKQDEEPPAPPATEKKEGPAAEEPEKPRTMRIDSLRIRIVEVQIYDYRKGTEPSVMTFPLNMDRTYTDVTNPKTLAAKIAAEVTANYIASIFGNVGKKMKESGDNDKLNKMFDNLGKSIEGLFKKKEK